MTDKTWKAAERVIARRLRGKRIGNTGRRTCDVESDVLAVEVKTRRNAIPHLIEDALLQAEMSKPQDKTPVAVLHDVGERHDYDLVCLWLCDFERLLDSFENRHSGE